MQDFLKSCAEDFASYVHNTILDGGIYQVVLEFLF